VVIIDKIVAQTFLSAFQRRVWRLVGPWIALWLGHESPTTTHQYTQANLAMKEKALARMQDPDTAAKRFKATDSLLEFLKTL